MSRRIALLADREWLVNQRRAGRSNGEIAAMVGCSLETVTRWVQRHGLARHYGRRVWRPDGYYKRCPSCRRTLPLREDGPGADRFWVHARWPDGRIKGWTPYCGRCMARDRRRMKARARKQINAGRRQRHAERMANDPAYRERKREWGRRAAARYLAKPEKAELARQASIRYHRERRARERDLVNEEARLHYALKKDRAGEPVQRRVPTVIDGTVPRVPAGPFRAWLAGFQDLLGLTDSGDTGRALGIEPRRVLAVMNDEGANVSFDLVDRALTNARWVTGRPWTVEALYPEDVILRATRRTR